MNIETISMDRIAAREAFAAYRAAVKARHSAEDEALVLGYRALARGMQLLDLNAVMQRAGVDHRFQPRLAIARADARDCFYECRSDRHRFWSDRQSSDAHTRRYVTLPGETFPAPPGAGRERYTLTPDGKRHWGLLRAMVPLIPAQYRPRGSLNNYHVLWEAVWELVPPVDPILLRHLHGSLYAVLAQWDLTPLERAVMHGRLRR